LKEGTVDFHRGEQMTKELRLKRVNRGEINKRYRLTAGRGADLIIFENVY